MTLFATVVTLSMKCLKESIAVGSIRRFLCSNIHVLFAIMGLDLTTNLKLTLIRSLCRPMPAFSFATRLFFKPIVGKQTFRHCSFTLSHHFCPDLQAFSNDWEEHPIFAIQERCFLWSYELIFMFIIVFYELCLILLLFFSWNEALLIM